jgi:hypothetical protein
VRSYQEDKTPKSGKSAFGSKDSTSGAGSALKKSTGSTTPKGANKGSSTSGSKLKK